jgi:hypothetical protein
MLDQLTHAPLVLGKRLDVLAWNPAASALYTDFSSLPPARRNYVHLLFTNPVVRELHQDWQHAARDAVAALRMEAAVDPDDPDFARLVGELTIQDADFRTWWAEHHVNSATSGTKHYCHRLVGDLALDCDAWAGFDGSGQRLMMLTAEAGSPSHDALLILTSWTAGRGNPARRRTGHRDHLSAGGTTALDRRWRRRTSGDRARGPAASGADEAARRPLSRSWATATSLRSRMTSRSTPNSSASRSLTRRATAPSPAAGPVTARLGD